MISGLETVPNTALTNYANTTHAWLFDDTQENYQKNLQNPAIAKHLSKEMVTYKLNTNGFRTKEIKEDKDSIVALGCSHTFGLGLREEDTYIAKHYIANDANPIINRQKNLLAIENICKIHNSNFYWYTEDIMIKETENDLARDWKHSGPKQNLKVAQLMCSDIS